MDYKVDEYGIYTLISDYHPPVPDSDEDAVRVKDLKDLEKTLKEEVIQPNVSSLLNRIQNIEHYLQIFASTYKIFDSSGNPVVFTPPS